MKFVTAMNELSGIKYIDRHTNELNNKLKEFQQSLHNNQGEKDPPPYDKWYGWYNYILFFFSLSVLGYIWEVILHFLQTGELVKRGVLSGPWLPIYGSGGILVLLLLRKVFKSPVITFFSSMFISGVLEYFTSYVLEQINGMRWWDYSGYFMNLNGRICLEGIVIFGLGACLVVYYIAPLLEGVFNKISSRIKPILCLVLIVLFVIDMVYSLENPNVGKGVTAGREIQLVLSDYFK